MMLCLCFQDELQSYSLVNMDNVTLNTLELTYIALGKKKYSQQSILYIYITNASVDVF